MPLYELLELIDYYLLHSGGDRWFFKRGLEVENWELGQSFFNSLNREDRDRIRGTVYDTFYVIGDDAGRKRIEEAIDFLTSK